MAMMKTMLTFLVDVGKSMNDPIQPGGSKKITTAATLIGSHMTQRIMASKTIEFSVVTYGSETTNNFLNSTDGGYENVDEVMAMGTKTFGNIADIYNLAASKDDTASDIIDGIAVAQDILIRCNAGKKYNRVLVLITDGESEVDPEGMEHLDVCTRKLRDDGFILYTLVLGRPVTPSQTYSENLKLFQQMTAVTATGGMKQIRHLGEGLSFLSSGPGLSTRPMPTKCQLNISPTVPSVPCVLWNRVMKQPLPSLKKQSRTYDPMDPGSGVVKRDTVHCNPDDPDEVIAMEHKIKGFKYGKNYVPITTEDMDMMKLPTIGGVTIMHFLPQSAVPRQYFMAGPVMMDPQPDNAVAATAMAALHQVLASTNQVGIVRVVKKDNAEPFLGCMQPTGPSTGTGAGLGTGFIIQRLPFSEDVRAYIFPSLNPYRVGEQRVKLQQTVSTFVDSMTYAKINTSAIVTFNPVLQTVIHELQHKALFGADNSSSSSDPTDSAKMAPLPDIVLIKPAVARKPVINQLLAQISQECSLEVQEKKEKKRKVYWDEIKVKPAAGEGADGASSSADDLSRTSSVSSLDSDVANLRMLMINSQTADSRAPAAGGGAGAGEGYKYRVLSRDNATNPAESLLQLLEGNTSENIIASVETMQGVIFDLIMVGATGAHCKKAVQCVKSMRAAAIHLGTIAAVTSYHAYLQSIKTTFKGAAGSRSKFWDLFSQEYMNNPENTECVSIIQSECKHSTLTGTAAEANARYFGEEAGDETAAVGPTQTEEVEEEDMFGDMM